MQIRCLASNMPKHKKTISQQIIARSGQPETITEMSRTVPEDPTSTSLVISDVKGHNLDAFAEWFAKEHSLPLCETPQGIKNKTPSSCDSLFVMKNSDLYLVEYKDLKVMEIDNKGKVEFIKNSTNDFKNEILKKLYDSYIMLNVEQLINYKQARTKTCVLIVVDEGSNGLGRTEKATAKIRHHVHNKATELRCFSNLRGVLYEDIRIMGSTTFKYIYLVRIKMYMENV